MQNAPSSTPLPPPTDDAQPGPVSAPPSLRRRLLLAALVALLAAPLVFYGQHLLRGYRATTAAESRIVAAERSYARTSAKVEQLLAAAGTSSACRRQLLRLRPHVIAQKQGGYASALGEDSGLAGVLDDDRALTRSRDQLLREGRAVFEARAAWEETLREHVDYGSRPGARQLTKIVQALDEVGWRALGLPSERLAPLWPEGRPKSEWDAQVAVLSFDSWRFGAFAPQACAADQAS